MCIDYRSLNSCTKKEIYALPRIDDAIDSLANAEYFSNLDLASGYHQIPVAEQDRKKLHLSLMVVSLSTIICLSD